MATRCTVCGGEFPFYAPDLICGKCQITSEVVEKTLQAVFAAMDKTDDWEGGQHPCGSKTFEEFIRYEVERTMKGEADGTVNHG